MKKRKPGHPGLKILSPLKTLDELMAQAGHYADFCLRDFRSMPPTLFLVGEDGPMMFAQRKLVTADDKEDFADTARLVCTAHAATACVLALQGWVKLAKPGEKLDFTEPPSEAFDRQEMIVLAGEDRSGERQQFFPIIRSDNGNFFNLGDSKTPAIKNKLEGLYAQILPPSVADQATRKLAKWMLYVKGSTIIGLKAQP